MRTDPDPAVQALLARTRQRRSTAICRLWLPGLLVATLFAAAAMTVPPGWRPLGVAAATMAYLTVAAMIAHGEGLPSALEIVAAQALVDAGAGPDHASDRVLAATAAQLWEFAGPDGPARVAARVDLPVDVFVARRDLARRLKAVHAGT